MATLVVSTPFAKAIQQVQIGPADMVATVTAAHAAWGWVGGLSGILSILRLSVQPSEEKKMQEIFKAIEPGLASCQILGQNGLETIGLPEDEAFGPTLSSKLVGMTFCALAFTMKPQHAINIFMEFFIDALFKQGLRKYPGSKEALHTFLNDNHPAILNEGAIHHLPEKFQNAISRFRGSTGLRGVSHPKLQDFQKPTDGPLINGFLRWLAQDIRDPYYTRSSAVARIAECLRAVGYIIGETTIWDGVGGRPSLHRTLVLVTGGASDTDDLMDDSLFKALSCGLVTHYKWDTVGAMLWNSLVQDCDYPHETFQEDFDDIKSTLEDSLKFRWVHIDAEREEIQAYPVWTKSRSSPSPTATRIATIFFPESVDQVSTLYHRVSSEKYLKAALSKKKIRPRGFIDHTREFHRVQVVTASICLAVLGTIGGEDFASLQHSTNLDLSDMSNIRWLCGEVDAILSGGCGMSRVIEALAAIHCAKEFPEGAGWGHGDLNVTNNVQQQPDSQVVVGWRNGRYAILPNLLLSMDKPLEQSILDIRCVDKFIANLPTRRTGAICCPIGLPGAIGFSKDFLEEMVTQEERDLEGQTLAHGEVHSIILGSAMPDYPDKPLYISLERPPFGFGEPEISVCGRLEGESLGHVGIHDILVTLALSWHDAEGQPFQACSFREERTGQHQASDGLPAQKVINMSPATYFRHPSVTPRCKTNQEPRHHIYVQVANDTPWTLFLAGQSSFLNRIVFGCPDCAVHAGANHFSSTSNGLRTLIGYQ